MARKLSSYISQLKFDPKLDDMLIAKYYDNPRLVIMVIILLLLAGIFSLLSIPRVLNPNINIPIVIVSTVYPGAGPQDVESLVTIPIENAVMGLSNVKTVTSTSQDSSSVVEIEFNDGVDPDKAQTDVQSAINNVSGLQSAVQKSSVQKVDFQNVPVWTFIVTGKTDDASLSRFAQLLSNNIKNVSTVSNVTTSGLDTQGIQIVIKPTAITTYELNPNQITQLISAAVSSYPAGTVKTNNSIFSLTINPELATVDDLRNLMLNIDNKTVPLSSIANIYQKSQPNQYESFFASDNKAPQHGVTFNVYKTDSASIDQSVKDVQKVVTDTLRQYNNEFIVTSEMNTSAMIDQQFSDLYHDFSITVLLVFLTLFIFVGLRQAIIALLSTPLTFLITFIIMNITGIPLSFIAIFSLLLSLGLLVDDTIVVISAMSIYYRTGKFTSHQTALLVWRDFLSAISTTTITTVWAFLPLLLATGIIGDFIKAIPIVVSSTLLGSYLVAMFVTLPLLIIILNPTIPLRVKLTAKILSVILLISLFLSILPQGKLFFLELLILVIFLIVTYLTWSSLSSRTQKYLRIRFKKSKLVSRLPYYFTHGVFRIDDLSERYKLLMYNILSSAKLRKRILVMVIIFSLFSYLLLPLGFVRNEFFPNTDQDAFFMNLEMPPGTNQQTTTKEALKILQQIKQTKGVDYVTLDVGTQASGGFGGGSSGSNFASFSIVLPPKAERKIGSIKLAQEMRDKFANYTTGTLQVVEQSSGPPAGADVQIKLFGNDLTTLDAYANKVESFLHKQPGLTNIDKSIKPGTSKIVFIPDKPKLASYNLTIDQLGMWLRLFSSGIKASDIRLSDVGGNTTMDITIRMANNEEFVNQISSINIPTTNGNIPLLSLGHLTLQANPTMITREGGQRTISVTASVQAGYSVSEANQKLLDYANNGLNLPTGYSWSTGGVNQTNQDSVTSILEAMLLSFLLIIITMVVQFGSFRKALIVMLVIPLSIAGVFIIFAITHTPLSFPALIGVLALFGIVVKNSILIVDKINQNYRIGMNHIEAIADAASSRLEPIALTSFATIVGLIPITLSDPLWQGLGGAIIAGLAFSGTIMLFFIPVVFYYWFRNDIALTSKI